MKKIEWMKGSWKKLLKEYLLTILSTAIIGAVCYPFTEIIGYQTVGLLFLMSISILSIFLDRGPVLFTAILSFFVWNYYFIPPVMTLHIHRIQDIIALFAFLGIALSSGILMARIKKNRHVLEKSQERIRVINSFLGTLNHAGSIRAVVERTQEVMNKQFGAEIIVYLKEKEGLGLSRKAFGNTALFSEQEYDMALPVFQNKPVVLSGLQYYPLHVQQGNIGVIGIQFSELRHQDEETLLLVRSFVAQLASALNREISIDIAKEKEIAAESQKLFQTVLNSVSHELRTPISIITAAVSTLDDETTAANTEIRKQVCGELNSAAQRLNVLVENILDMSRIDSGYLHLNKQTCDITDLVGMTMNDIQEDIRDASIRVTIEDNLPTVQLDTHWFKQALANVLRNAIQYTPAGSEILLSAYTDAHGSIVLEISDHGPGVPDHSLKKLFNKFYRVPGSKSGGIGLGLTVTKAIVEAHKGTIVAKNREGGGLTITIILGSWHHD